MALVWNSYCGLVAFLFGLCVLQNVKPSIGQIRPFLISQPAVENGVFSIGTSSALLVNSSLDPSQAYLPICIILGGIAQDVYLWNADTNTELFQWTNVKTVVRQLFHPIVLSPNMTGELECRFLNNAASSDKYNLQVVVSPTISSFGLSSNESVILTGKNIDVLCCATGYPRPVISIEGSTVTKVNESLASGIWSVCANSSIPNSQEAGTDRQFNCSAVLSTINCTNIMPAVTQIGAAFQLCETERLKTDFKAFTVLVAAPNCSTTPSGTFSYTYTNYLNYLSTATVVCGGGFQPTDQAATTTQCLATGRWSDPIPTCTDIDECSTVGSCQHGRTCSNTIGSFNCTCPAGYAGTKCETDIDECATFRCFHGTCNNLLGSFSCTCTAGFTGQLCETVIAPATSAPATSAPATSAPNACLPSSCVNGGTCMPTENSFNCSCVAGFYGQRCQTEIHERRQSCDFAHMGENCDKLSGAMIAIIAVAVLIGAAFIAAGIYLLKKNPCRCGCLCCQCQKSCDKRSNKFEKEFGPKPREVEFVDRDGYPLDENMPQPNDVVPAREENTYDSLKHESPQQKETAFRLQGGGEGDYDRLTRPNYPTVTAASDADGEYSKLSRGASTSASAGVPASPGYEYATANYPNANATSDIASTAALVPNTPGYEDVVNVPGAADDSKNNPYYSIAANSDVNNGAGVSPNSGMPQYSQVQKKRKQ